MGFDLLQLRLKVTVGIYRTFGCSGTTGGKENGRHVISECLNGSKGFPGNHADLFQAEAAPEPASTHSYPGSDGFEKFGIQGP